MSTLSTPATTTHRLVVLTGTSGVGLGAIAQRIKPLLGDSWTHLEFESFLFEVDADDHAGDIKYERPTLQQLLTGPDAALRRLWSLAFAKAKSTITDELTRSDVLLRMHASWFLQDSEIVTTCINYRAVSYWPVDAEKIINIIDDIYDTHCRLASAGGIFETPIGTFDRRVKSLIRLLEWREAEFLATRTLASAMGADSSVFLLAAKHPLTTLADLIKQPTPRTLYLSHPITAVRVSGDFNDPVIRQVHSIVEHFRKNYVVFEPTTIDELRIGQDSTCGYLTARWPVDSSMPIVEPVSSSSILRSDQRDPDKEPGENAYLEALKNSINSQINWRDRQLVTQSGSLIALRPFAKESGEISGGMDEEMALYVQLCGLDRERGHGVMWNPVNDERRRLLGAVRCVVGRWVVAADGSELTDGLPDRLVEECVRVLHAGIADSVSSERLGHLALACIRTEFPSAGLRQEFRLGSTSNLRVASVRSDLRRAVEQFGDELRSAPTGFSQQQILEYWQYQGFSPLPYDSEHVFTIIRDDLTTPELITKLDSLLSVGG